MNRVIQWILWFLVFALTQGLLLVLLAWLVPGIQVHSFAAAVLGGVIITLVLGLAWRLIYWSAARLHPILFPLLTFFLTGIVIILAVNLVDLLYPGALEISGLWDAILVALVVTLGMTFLGALFSLQDDRGYDWFVTQPLSRRYNQTPHAAQAGILFLEIDGLAEPVLRSAMDQGWMPTLKRWLEGGTHQIKGWEPDLSSQTSASQAGILLGNNAEIPAFRWYDKQQQKLMVSSKVATARALEQQLSNGHGLLTPDGGSRWNVFSGDAPDCLGTYSKMGARTSRGQQSYFLYFSNPYSVARTFGLFIVDIVRERYQAWQQRRQDVQPRIHRTFKYALVRAGTTVFLQEASLFMLLADMLRGVPAVYTTLFAYDEVAHHSGIMRPDAFKVLKKLAHLFAQLERASQRAPRPYHLVVLSDHGQSQGATFTQRYGQSLGQLVEQLVAQSTLRVAGALDPDEGWDSLSTALTEALRKDSRTMRLVRRALRGQMHDGQVALSPQGEATEEQISQKLSGSQVLVLASGNLGLISFTDDPARLTYEQLSHRFPGLLLGLSQHEGISFLLVHSETEGGLVLGAKGIYYLEQGYAVGENPLAPFGPSAAAHLKRTDGFSNAPDILVMSLYRPETGEVAAFEELVGCHGGLGGPQTHPFVLYPVVLPMDPGPIVGAAALHTQLKTWVRTSSKQSKLP